jgi:hypothetical protein
MVPELAEVGGIWPSLVLGAESGVLWSCVRSSGLIDGNCKSFSRFEGDGVVSEVRVYDRYCTQATTMPASASTVARQPKIMVRVSSVPLESADMLIVSTGYELGTSCPVAGNRLWFNTWAVFRHC